MLLPTDRITAKTAAQLITGICQRTAYNYINRAREYLGKQPHQPLTVAQFCHYYGIPLPTPHP